MKETVRIVTHFSRMLHHQEVGRGLEIFELGVESIVRKRHETYHNIFEETFFDIFTDWLRFF